jgi:hypothetical protein
MSLTLSDTQVAAITIIARPVPPPERRQFMGALLEELIHTRRDR